MKFGTGTFRLDIGQEIVILFLSNNCAIKITWCSSYANSLPFKYTLELIYYT